MERNQVNHLPGVIRKLLVSWLAAALAVYRKIPPEVRGLEGLQGLKEMSFGLFVIVIIGVFTGLCLGERFLRITERVERWLLFFLYVVLAAGSLCASFSLPFLGIIVLMAGILLVYVFWGWNRGQTLLVKEKGCDRAETVIDKGRKHKAVQWKEKHCHKLNQWIFSLNKTENKTVTIIVAGLAVAFFLFVSIWTVFRVLTYCAPSFDMGIFSQMFYRMKTTGLPDTTIERDGLLSHFQVHVSPVYYLLLPLYCLWPTPEMLQILQAGVMASAFIPAWKLVRKHGCSNGAGILLCLLLALYPAYAGGAAYDIHENVFLTSLLLWLFYEIDCKKGRGVAVAAVLTLCVKEDAAVYVAVIGLWLLCSSLLHKHESRWGIWTGGIMLAGSFVWFLAVTGYLAGYGDGVMTYRYKNFMYDGSKSLFTVIKAAILSPMKVLYECVDEEKLSFIALTMLPLWGLPLATRRYERYILWIPYVLVNLMSDYTYQHNIFFQYMFGSVACLFYLTVVNYQEMKAVARNTLYRYVPLCLAVVVSAICFGMRVVPKAVTYPARYIEQRERFVEIRELLAEIPEEASVTATTFYTVPVANRKVLYDVRYSSKEHLLSTEYVVLEVDQTGSYVNYEVNEGDGYEQLVKILEENGYEVFGEIEEEIVVYKK